MDKPHENDSFDEKLYLAGERVSEGLYQQIGSGREVRFEHEDVLPASLDGRVACYRRVCNRWSQLFAQATKEQPGSPPPNVTG